MRVPAKRTSRLASKRAAGLLGLLVALGSAPAACGSNDGAPGGSGGVTTDAGGGTSAAEDANANDSSSVDDARSSGADARSPDGAAGDGSTPGDAAGGDGAETADGGADGAGTKDAAVDAGADANGGTIVIRVDPRNDCTVTTTPPSPIQIPAGQFFYATFINVGEISTDIDKRDPFNLVPLVLGLEPGMTYADTIRPWCQGFSGKFWFEISPCQGSPYDLEVDCGP